MYSSQSTTDDMSSQNRYSTATNKIETRAGEKAFRPGALAFLRLLSDGAAGMFLTRVLSGPDFNEPALTSDAVAELTLSYLQIGIAQEYPAMRNAANRDEEGRQEWARQWIQDADELLGAIGRYSEEVSICCEFLTTSRWGAELSNYSNRLAIASIAEKKERNLPRMVAFAERVGKGYSGAVAVLHPRAGWRSYLASCCPPALGEAYHDLRVGVDRSSRFWHRACDVFGDAVEILQNQEMRAATGGSE
jgi:hypothetical protein